jgi:hypothetical protein
MLIKQQDNLSPKKRRKGNFYSLTLSKICLDFGDNLILSILAKKIRLAMLNFLFELPKNCELL